MSFKNIHVDRCITHFQELVKGAICVDTGKSEIAHQGITLVMEGSVNLQLSAKSVGLFEAFYSSLKVSKNGLFHISSDMILCLILDVPIMG